MRVLTVSHFYEAHGGGIERVAGQLNRAFLLAGHHPAWAASDADGLPDTSITPIALRCVDPAERLSGLPMPLPGPRSIVKLRQAVQRSDAVVIHDALYATSVLAMLLAKASRKPVVLIQHIAAIEFANPLLRVLMRLANALVTAPMLAAADRLVFISETVREDLLGNAPKRQSLLLFNGVDHGIFHPVERAPRVVTRARWGLPETAPLAIFVGRFVNKKGLTVLKDLAARRPNVHFALLGKGPIDPRKWGLPNIHLLGQQSQDLVADLYRAGDLLLLPSVGEGFPLVVQEAMACGLPVICGEASARADPAAGGWLSGVTIDLADPDASAERCARALDSLLTRPVDRAGMARYAAEAYDWGRMAEEVLAGLSATSAN